MFEVTTGAVPAEAVTPTLPETVLFRVTEATPFVVVAVAVERLPLPLTIVNATTVPFAIVPFTRSAGETVAVIVTGVTLLATPETGFAASAMEPGLLGLVKLMMALLVAGAAVAVTVTLPSAELFSVTDALPLASVNPEQDRRSEPMPRVNVIVWPYGLRLPLSGFKVAASVTCRPWARS